MSLLLPFSTACAAPRNSCRQEQGPECGAYLHPARSEIYGSDLFSLFHLMLEWARVMFARNKRESNRVDAGSVWSDAESEFLLSLIKMASTTLITRAIKLHKLYRKGCEGVKCFKGAQERRQLLQKDLHLLCSFSDVFLKISHVFLRQRASCQLYKSSKFSGRFPLPLTSQYPFWRYQGCRVIFHVVQLITADTRNHWRCLALRVLEKWRLCKEIREDSLAALQSPATAVLPPSPRCQWLRKGRSHHGEGMASTSLRVLVSPS